MRRRDAVVGNIPVQSWAITALLALILLLIELGCVRGRVTEPVEPRRSRTVLDVACAADGGTDSVSRLAFGFGYQLLEGDSDAGRSAWVDADRIVVELSGLLPNRRYLVALEVAEELRPYLAQQVGVDGKTCAEQWYGELLGIDLAPDTHADGAVTLELVAQNSCAILSALRLVEEPRTFPVQPVDMSRTELAPTLSVVEKISRVESGGMIEVRVDAQETVGRLNRVWEGVSGSTKRMAELGVRSVRLGGRAPLLRALADVSSPRWDDVRREVDLARSIGARPMVCFGMTPPELADLSRLLTTGPGASPRGNPLSGTAPPASLRGWTTLASDLINCCGAGAVEYFEPWDRPDNAYSWAGTREEYFELYCSAAKALRGSVPQLGGPSAAIFEPVWISQFLNAVRESGAPLDFLSWHEQTSRPKQIVARAQLARQLLAEAGLPETIPLIIDGWSYPGRTEDTRFDTEFCASFAAAMISAMEDAGVHLAIYDQAYDIPDLGVRNGLLLYDGKTPKPLYNVFRMFSFLGDTRVDCESSSDGFGIGSLAAAGDDEVCVILWWWLDGNGAERAMAPVQLMVEGLPDKPSYRWEMYAVDDKDSNFAAGTDRRELTVAARGQLEPYARHFVLNISLPLYGTQMVRLIPNE